MEYTKLKQALRGVAFTTPTPFTNDKEKVQLDEISNHASWLENNGARVFIPCGNTGEYYSLTNEERVSIVESTVDALSKKCTVIGGAGGSTKTVEKITKQYGNVGADAIMIMQPSHTFIHKKGVLKYYEEVIESTDLGVVLYKRGNILKDNHIEYLSEFNNVIGVKYAVNDIEGFSRANSKIANDVVLSNGIAERFAPAFGLEGAEGFTTGVGNIVPKAPLLLMEKIEKEQWDDAKSIRDHFRPYETLREETGETNPHIAANNVPSVKYGLEIADRYGGPVREPLVELSEQDKAQAEEAYQQLKKVENMF